MNFRKILGIFVFIMATFVAFAQYPALSEEPVRVSAQGVEVVSADSTVSVSVPQAPMQNEADTQWAWGEVTSLDSQAKTLNLKYFDYETDQVKELVLAVDEKTAYENIKSFDDIKIKDTLSIDYATGPENKNIAKNISLERPDALAPAPQQPVANVSQPSVPIEIPVPENASQAQPEVADGSSVEVTEPSKPVPASPAPEPASVTQGQTQ